MLLEPCTEEAGSRTTSLSFGDTYRFPGDSALSEEAQYTLLGSKPVTITPLRVSCEHPTSKHSWNSCHGPSPRDRKPELESWWAPTHTLFTHGSHSHRKPVVSSSETGHPRTSGHYSEALKGWQTQSLGSTLYMKSSRKAQLPSTAHSSKHCLFKRHSRFDVVTSHFRNNHMANCPLFHYKPS